VLVASSPLCRLPSNHHRLGHVLNPTDPDSEDCDRMRRVWAGIVQETLGLHFEWPGWLDRLAAIGGRNHMPAHRLRSDNESMLDFGRP
jgi:hypothetical protein